MAKIASMERCIAVRCRDCCMIKQCCYSNWLTKFTWAGSAPEVCVTKNNISQRYSFTYSNQTEYESHAFL
jgi:hypothetical protein